MQRNQKECDVYLYGNIETLESGRKKVKAKGKMPCYMTKDAAAADIFLPDDVTLAPKEYKEVDLWIGFDIPKGYYLEICPRSSLIRKGIISPTGKIDRDYGARHIHAQLFNFTDQTIILKKDERICQVSLIPKIDCINWEHASQERTGGLGHTDNTRE